MRLSESFFLRGISDGISYWIVINGSIQFSHAEGCAYWMMCVWYCGEQKTR